MEYRILGPLEVAHEGEPVPLGRPKERLVLAVLLLHANEFVSRERLIDEIWGAAPPPTAKKAVNVYVSQLRKALARNAHDPITTADGGYRLRVDPDELDAGRLRQLLATAHERESEGKLEAAAQLLREVLALWRGPTLSGLLLESHGREEIAQLDEHRLTALMDRIDCDLALGRHEEVLGELHVLVGEHPLRERLRAQQMLALYRADRQADALDAYQQARHDLIDELGIEPSESLQRLQQGILRHDPALEAPAGTAGVNGLAPPPATPLPVPTADVVHSAWPWRFRPRRWQLALAALVILAAATSAAIVSTWAGATPRVVPNSLVRLDPRNGKIVSVTPVGVEPGPIAVTPSAIWTVNFGARTVSRYDLRTHRVDQKGGFPIRPYGIVADHDGNVWVSSEASIITRIARGSGGTSAGPLYFSHTKFIRLPRPGAGSLALGGGYLWVIVGPYTAPGDNRITQVSLARDQPVRSWQLKGDTVAIAFGAGAAWVTTNYAGVGLLNVIRPGAPRPESVHLENGNLSGPLAISVGEGGVWVITWGTNGGIGPGSPQALLEFDPDTLQRVNRIPFYGRGLWALAAGGGSIWVAASSNSSPRNSSVIQLDPRSGRIIQTIPIGSPNHAITCGIAATNDAVWVTVGDANCDINGQ
jgi:DNA-binding SARP family transcriptional activator